MSCSVTSVFTFKIESTFDEWAAIFDSEEADKRHSEFDIKPLFRGVSKDDPQKIIVIHQAPEGNVQKFVEANGDWICLLYTSPSPRDMRRSRMPSSA